MADSLTQLRRETTGPPAEGILPGMEGGWRGGLMTDVGSY